MVLSYYIATQTVEEHLRFYSLLSFFCFFFTVVFLIFLKNKMQHIPVVGHALWRGTLILKMLDMVPTVQTGSYHRQDLCLFTVGESHEGTGGEGEVSGRQAEVPPRFRW